MGGFRPSSRTNTILAAHLSRFFLPTDSIWLTWCSTEELRILLPDETNITDSPDLGPPPVAHFDDGDPVKYDKSPLIESGNAAEESDLPGDLAFANLETRRKRKDNNAPKESLQSEKLNDQNQRSAASSSQILKQGAKRKLSTRDDGDGISAVSSDTNPFSFVRRSETQSVPEETSRHPAAGNKSTAASRNKGKDGAPSRGASRKALGESEYSGRLQDMADKLCRGCQYRPSQLTGEESTSFGRKGSRCL